MEPELIISAFALVIAGLSSLGYMKYKKVAMSALEQFIEVLNEGAEVMKALSMAIGDDKITENEIKEIQKHAEEFRKAVEGLLALFKK